ncbi:helix-turn-helix transcriptional regulator [Priestia filamentosa]|uniref:XRE family transcriptional regulator n=1 Tax=Priestia filamentosa TaxID=1402861 RepID=A0A2L1FFR0_9BACI|nr:helix-turn-helix transcriptional regulator [Priestia filamentosa]AVD54583.1 XRE family transcriptional regulator [Priestia filamentosa]AWG44923.1 XRE family transcriptional regulator [Priestia filamentosa]RJS63155.1 XRE family transcriptional regulator [Priestia filamentosa]WRU97805.1 helix-turn-helix transcriptional regulator [Priestia filamentosa]
MSSKQRGKLGKWLDKRGIKQQWLVKETKLARNTIGDICAGRRTPTTPTLKKLMKALRKVDPNAKVDDFFDI